MLEIQRQKAAQFLLQGQSPDGAWRDFDLEPGESDAWVTAYVSGCLLQFIRAAPCTPHQDALERAAIWLRDALRPDGGWGYNATCPVDSDSTAHAMLFLSSYGMWFPRKCYDRLLKFQRNDGGFATFERHDPGNGWGISHPDVSPVALQALLTSFRPEHLAIRRGLAYSLGAIEAEGLWPSYWWTTPLYATLANVRLLEGTHTLYDRAHVTHAVENYPGGRSVFESALLAETLAVLAPGDRRATEVARTLAEQQFFDGSWRAPGGILRVTDPRFLRPWLEPASGIIASDPRHFFTTATVLRCLCAFIGST